MKKRLNDKTVAKLIEDCVPKKGSIIVWHDDSDSEITVPGFGLRITSTGVASFILNYRNAEGRERRNTIGRWPRYKTARAYSEAKIQWEDLKDSGIDPLDKKEVDRIVTKTAEWTLNDEAKEYLEWAAAKKRKSSIRDDKGMLNGVILPHLGSKPMAEIYTADVDKIHDAMRATPFRANRVLALLSKIFNNRITKDAEKREKWHQKKHDASEQEPPWISTNPVKRVQRFAEQKRDKFLSLEQCVALKQALDEYPSQDVANIVRLALLTGSRIGEVRSVEWSEINLKEGTWRKPAQKVKQKKSQTVMLSSAAVDVLKSIPRKTVIRDGKLVEIPFVFPAKSLRAKSPYRGYLKWSWEKVCQAAELKARAAAPEHKDAGIAEEYTVRGRKGKELIRWRPLFRVHDLRHTLPSILASNGVSLYTLQQMLGHQNPETTQIYSTVEPKAQKQAAEQFPRIIGW